MKQRRSIFCLLMGSSVLCLCLVVLFALAPPSVFARTKVQSGYTPVINTATYTVNIEEVDLDKSIILYTVKGNTKIFSFILMYLNCHEPVGRPIF